MSAISRQRISHGHRRENRSVRIARHAPLDVQPSRHDVAGYARSCRDRPARVFSTRCRRWSSARNRSPNRWSLASSGESFAAPL